MKRHESKRNDFWIESEDTDPCPCCNWVKYRVRGWDHEGDWYESELFMCREDADERVEEKLKEGLQNETL